MYCSGIAVRCSALLAVVFPTPWPCQNRPQAKDQCREAYMEDTTFGKCWDYVFYINNCLPRRRGHVVHTRNPSQTATRRRKEYRGINCVKIVVIHLTRHFFFWLSLMITADIQMFLDKERNHASWRNCLSQLPNWSAGIGLAIT